MARTTRKIVENDIAYIKVHYRIKKAKDIGADLGLSINQIYEVARKYGLQQPQNIMVKFNRVMDQIILSGILGDGRLKRNGSKNYYYSECHALGEKEYLRWKFDNLGELTKYTKMYGEQLYSKNMNNISSDALEFTTLTTPSLVKYAEMSNLEVIEKLDDLGLLLLVFDDGWTQKYKAGHTVYISGGTMTERELEALSNRCNSILGITPNIVGNKRKDLRFKASDGHVFEELSKKYDMDKLDVAIKKFG